MMKNWRQSKYPRIGTLEKCEDILEMQFYIAVRINELEPTTWANLTTLNKQKRASW